MILRLIRPLGQTLGLYILLLASGCEEEPPVTKPTAPNTNAPAAEPSGGAAQAKLPTIKLFLGAAELIAEVADENHERQAGMMHRTEMGENEAMLFVFPYPHQTGFWMKNTTLPLSIAYIDRESRIAEIHNLQPGNTNTVESRSRQIMYALEVNQGWFSKNGIKPGNVISTESGPLSRAVRSR